MSFNAPDINQFKVIGSTVGDVYFPQTELLLPFDGTNGATTTSDSSNSNHTVTFNGTAQISTAQSKFGGSSLLLDGNSDYLTMAASSSLSFDADFTIECWVKTSNSTLDTHWRRIFHAGNTDAADNLAIIFNSSTYGNVYSNTAIITGNITVTDGNWHHIALCRSGTSLRYFVDGVQSGSTATTSQNFTGGADEGVWIGKYGSGSGHFDGYIDDFRITKASARYTSSFTPSTTAHLTSAGDVNKQIIVNSTADGVAIGTGGINQARIAKAWAHFDATGTAAIKDSYNISSLTDRGTGLFTLTFSTAMNNVYYTAASSVGSAGASSSISACQPQQNSITATDYVFSTYYTNSSSSGNWDHIFNTITFFGN